MNDRAELDKFAQRYAKAWFTQDPEKVATFSGERGSISINHGLRDRGQGSQGPAGKGQYRKDRKCEITHFGLWRTTRWRRRVKSRRTLATPDYELA
jgi:hypothetical protein